MESSFCCRDDGGKAVGSVERRRGSREYPTVLDSKTRMSFGCFDVESVMLILFEKSDSSMATMEIWRFSPSVSGALSNLYFPRRQF